MAEDKAEASIVRLCNVLYDADVYIIHCSGRNDEHHPETTDARTLASVRADQSKIYMVEAAGIEPASKGCDQ